MIVEDIDRHEIPEWRKRGKAILSITFSVGIIKE